MRTAYLFSALLGVLVLATGLFRGSVASTGDEAAAADVAGAAGAGTAGTAVVVRIKGAIGPATSGHVSKALAHARDTGARVLVIHMDTPGGLDSAMRDIIQDILASPVPVISYVAPSGARAASAGTYILYASHVAAMAPATNLGAATPVQIGGSPAPGGQPPEKADDQAKGKSAPESGGQSGEAADDARAGSPPPQPGTAMERKAVNDAVAYIRGLAQLRGRNADWAEEAVRSAVSLESDEALARNVIDLVAADLASLLQAVNGREVDLGGSRVTLDTASLVIEEFEADWRTRLLETITDPNVAYLLMLVGIYGLIFEGYNPGAIVPGVVGAICLLLALFAFQVLSVNYAGLALIALGVVLIVAEAFVPSFGALGLGGIVAFVFGSIMLLDSPIPGLDISRSLIGGIALAASAALLGMVLMLVRVRRRPVVSGAEGMLGETGEALDDFSGTGPVFIHGERWQARSRQPLRRGQRVRVLAIRGLTLEVEPAPGD